MGSNLKCHVVISLRINQEVNSVKSEINKNQDFANGKNLSQIIKQYQGLRD